MPMLLEHSRAVGAWFLEQTASLEGVLKERGLEVVPGALLVAHVGDGLICSAPVRPGATDARGVFVTTIELSDMLTRKRLQPGAYLVSLRPVDDGVYALDYASHQGPTFSTHAKPIVKHHGPTPAPEKKHKLDVSAAVTQDYAIFCASWDDWANCWSVQF